MDEDDSRRCPSRSEKRGTAGVPRNEETEFWGFAIAADEDDPSVRLRLPPPAIRGG